MRELNSEILKWNHLKYHICHNIETLNWHMYAETAVFAATSYFVILIYLQPDGGHLWYLKLRLFGLTEHSLKFQKSTTLGCKKI